jgi:hypothetical protein
VKTPYGDGNKADCQDDINDKVQNEKNHLKDCRPKNPAQQSCGNAVDDVEENDTDQEGPELIARGTPLEAKGLLQAGDNGRNESFGRGFGEIFRLVFHSIDINLFHWFTPLNLMLKKRKQGFEGKAANTNIICMYLKNWLPNQKISQAGPAGLAGLAGLAADATSFMQIHGFNSGCQPN